MSAAPRRRKALLWVGFGLVIAAAIVVFLASRGGSARGGPENVIVEAAERTAHEPGGHIAFRSSVPLIRSKSTPITGAMVFDGTGVTAGTVRLSYPDDRPPTVMHVIADGGNAYIRQEALFQKEGKWLDFGYSVGEREEESESGFAGADAGRDLKALGEATDVVRLGRAKVRGVESTRYRGNTPALGPVEVWIDGHGRVRRLRIVGSKVEHGNTPTPESTTEFFDFGPVPAIKTPTRTEVDDISEFIKMQLALQKLG